MKQPLKNQQLTSKGTGLREKKRNQLHDTIREKAWHLFLKQGFGQTTIRQIAEEANVSQRTFFRYFPTKEDVFLEDEFNTHLIYLLQQRPENEAINEKIEHAILESLEKLYQPNKKIRQQRNKLIIRSPELRARLWESQNTMANMMAEVIVNKKGRPTFNLRVITASYLAAMSTAFQEWVSEENTKELTTLMREAFSAISSNRLT